MPMQPPATATRVQLRAVPYWKRGARFLVRRPWSYIYALAVGVNAPVIAICMFAECADGARLGFGKSPTLDSGLGLRGLHCPLDTVYDTYTVPCTTVPVPTVGGIAV